MAHPDLDTLMNAAIPFAQQMLRKYGEFYPFGVSMNAEGEIMMDAGYNGVERPASQELIDLLTDAYREKARSGGLRAAGICADVRVIPPGQSHKSDAIRVSLEHHNGEAVDVILPYKKRWFGRMSYGVVFASHRDRTFFTT